MIRHALLVLTLLAAGALPVLAAPSDPSEEAIEEYHMERIPVNDVPAGSLLQRVDSRLLPPNVHIQPDERVNSLIVQGTNADVAHLKTLVRFIDVPVRQLSLEIGVTSVGAGNGGLRFRSQTWMMNAQQVVLDDRAPSLGQGGGVRVTLKPVINGDGTVLVDSDWDLNLPVPGTKSARLVKRLATTTRAMPGKRVDVGEVDGSTWGGKGTVRVWLKATILPDPFEVEAIAHPSPPPPRHPR